MFYKKRKRIPEKWGWALESSFPIVPVREGKRLEIEIVYYTCVWMWACVILFLFCCHLPMERTIEGFGINIIELTFNQLVSSVPANWCLFNDVKFFHTAIGVVLPACVLFVQKEWIFFFQYISIMLASLYYAERRVFVSPFLHGGLLSLDKRWPVKKCKGYLSVTPDLIRYHTE